MFNTRPLGQKAIELSWSLFRHASSKNGVDLYFINPRGIGMAEPQLQCHEVIQINKETIRICRN